MLRLRHTLRKSGLNIETCAEDFLDRHDVGAPGCAIVDLGLPGMDGLGIQQSLRARGVARPLIFLTGRGDIGPSPGMLTLCAAAGMGFGAANEVVEFAAKLMIPDTNVGGYENTGWDLVSNMAGAIAGSALIWLRHRGRDRA